MEKDIEYNLRMRERVKEFDRLRTKLLEVEERNKRIEK